MAVARQPARVPAERLGSLVINPGGPGGSGIDDLPTELRVLTASLQDHFDIVSFDPRGVGRSDAVTCSPGGTSAGQGASTTPGLDPTPSTETGQAALVSADRAFAAACLQYSPQLLGRIGTADVVDDLEVLRRALGDPGLTFFGHSYGTYLGARYADAFPNRVRSMVLDGAIDPALTLTQMVSAQAESFDMALQAFFAWCESTSACPWQTGGDARGRFLALMARVRAHPLGPAGPAELYDAVLGTMYSPSFWGSLGRALASAESGDGGSLAALARDYRNTAGPNGQAAFLDITCLDHPAPAAVTAYSDLAGRAAASAPVFGPLFAWGELQCAVWPVPPTSAPRAVGAVGSPPILVVGTTEDPATPLAWAASLARQLPRAALLVREGRDHVAYYYSSCVREAVDRYLVGAVVPPPGEVCAS